MSYTGYETATDELIKHVETLCASLTAGGSRFDASTQPTRLQVDRFITTAHAEIALMLESAGFSSSQTNATVLALLQSFNARAAAYEVEISRGSAGFVSPESTQRGSMFYRWRKDFAELLDGSGLARLGGVVLAASASGVTMGGVSISDKETISTDTDMQRLSFGVDLHKNPSSVVGAEESA